MHWTHYDNYSDEDLCVGYLLMDNDNIHKPSRKKAADMRNLDCLKYVDLARLELEKESIKKNNSSSSSNSNYGQETFKTLMKTCRWEKVMRDDGLYEDRQVCK